MRTLLHALCVYRTTPLLKRLTTIVKSGENYYDLKNINQDNDNKLIIYS